MIKRTIIFTLGQQDMQVLSEDGSTAFSLNTKDTVAHDLQEKVRNKEIVVNWMPFDSGKHNQMKQPECTAYTDHIYKKEGINVINVTFPLIEKTLSGREDLGELDDIWLVYTDRSDYSGPDKKIKDFVNREAFYTAKIIEDQYDSVKKQYEFAANLHLINFFEGMEHSHYNLTKELAFEWCDRWVRDCFVRRRIDPNHRFILAIAGGMSEISRYCEEVFFAYFPEQTIVLIQDQSTGVVQPSRIHELRQFNTRKKELIARTERLDFHGALSLTTAFTDAQKKTGVKGFKLIDLACKWMDQDYEKVDNIISDLMCKCGRLGGTEMPGLLDRMRDTNSNIISKCLIRYRDLIGRRQYVYAGVVLVSLSEMLAIRLLKKLDGSLFQEGSDSDYNYSRLSELNEKFLGRELGLSTERNHWNFHIIERSIEAWCQEKENAFSEAQGELLHAIKCVIDTTGGLRDERNQFIHKGKGFVKKIIDKITKNDSFWSVVFMETGAEPDWRKALATQAKRNLEQMEHCLF